MFACIFCDTTGKPGFQISRINIQEIFWVIQNKTSTHTYTTHKTATTTTKTHYNTEPLKIRQLFTIIPMHIQFIIENRRQFTIFLEVFGQTSLSKHCGSKPDSIENMAFDQGQWCLSFIQQFNIWHISWLLGIFFGSRILNSTIFEKGVGGGQSGYFCRVLAICRHFFGGWRGVGVTFNQNSWYFCWYCKNWG